MGKAQCRVQLVTHVHRKEAEGDGRMLVLWCVLVFLQFGTLAGGRDLLTFRGDLPISTGEL